MAPVPDIGTVSHSVSSTPTQPDLPSSSSDSPDSTYYHPSGLTMFFVIELPLIVILIFSILVAVVVRRCKMRREEKARELANANSGQSFRFTIGAIPSSNI
ncbi:uncharacterized protein RAG0_01356 [Rhynchosporium agropyri]|uniref:Uncharacterized protein n=1 Tax=Rhynchosporium agropyri TaxID=914238 RepID=A0A1E1JWL9_9HELO|nr:uncharacterized protein RAG0_01356 [Rhynchosporium agropyri]